MLQVFTLSYSGNLKYIWILDWLVPRWRWLRGRPLTRGMGHGTGPWSIYLQEGEQQQRAGSADRTMRRKEESTWVSTGPLTSSFPWKSPNQFLPAPLSPLSPHWHQPGLLQQSPRLRLPWLPLVWLLLLMSPPKVASRLSRDGDVLFLVSCDFCNFLTGTVSRGKTTNDHSYWMVIKLMIFKGLLGIFYVLLCKKNLLFVCFFYINIVFSLMETVLHFNQSPFFSPIFFFLSPKLTLKFNLCVGFQFKHTHTKQLTSMQIVLFFIIYYVLFIPIQWRLI